ncbi:MAG: hypothetical protein FJ272_02040 [Planctomycetes bacterium]|nr:hypothetical protein [Planctomycetota bacterium]
MLDSCSVERRVRPPRPRPQVSNASQSPKRSNSGRHQSPALTPGRRRATGSGTRPARSSGQPDVRPVAPRAAALGPPPSPAPPAPR